MMVMIKVTMMIMTMTKMLENEDRLFWCAIIHGGDTAADMAELLIR